MSDSRTFVSAAGSWARSQRAGFALVGAVILGQLSRVLFETLRHAEFLTTGKPPLLGVLALVVALVWYGVIIWARLRIGQDLNSWARGWFSGFAVTDSIPRRYVIEDRGSLLAAALAAVLDLVLLLVMQNTVREPLLMVTSSYLSPAWADGAFVVLVVVVALLILSHMYQTSKPVSAYLAWSVMDRLVPTAGFLAGSTAPALAGGTTSGQPALDRPAPRPVTAGDANQETAVSERRAAAEKTVADEVTVRAPAANPEHLADEVTVRAPSADTEHLADEVTVRAPSVDPEQTTVSEKTVVAEKHPDAKGNQQQ